VTYKEAKRILHPDTTREALVEIGFKGKEKLQEAVDEACLMACDALDKQIPKPPVVLNQKDSKNFFCVACGMRLVSEINGELCAGRKTSFCHDCGSAIVWRDDNGET
jgi:hypothetical protein